MSGRDPTQKQIAEKYKGNLDYFRRGHYLRRWRGICFALAVAGSIGTVVSFRYWGKPEYLSTGPISENHARFARDCQACHQGAEPDLIKVLGLEKVAAGKSDAAPGAAPVEPVSLPVMERLRAAAGVAGKTLSKDLNKENALALARKGLSFTSISLMDRACLKCHEPMGLHQPQSEVMALRSVLKELPLVHSGACSTCHREHIGHGRMKLPTSETCETCHNDASELARTRDVFKIAVSNPPIRGQNRDLGDGVIRFLSPPPPGAAKAFKSYADGHPPFAYEQGDLRDPARIKYNHVRHRQGDIPEINGHKLDCADCHKPGPGGVRYQPVSFQKHCESCHSLQLSPSLPEVRTPHGDADKVRDFLRADSLTLHFAEAIRQRGITDRAELGKLIKAEFSNLADRGMTTQEELERRVFFAGDPPIEVLRNSPRSNRTPFFAACAKCHDVESGGARAPKIMPTNVAERWVQRGPFTHQPHSHMNCVDCHAGALTSKLTTDILLPPQKLCAECHRPLEKEKLIEARDSLQLREELVPGTRELARAQRISGGVKDDCQSCHRFHAPPSASMLLETVKR